MDPIVIWFGLASAAGTTAISVTHDQSEFDSLGNRSPRTPSKATALAEGVPRQHVYYVHYGVVHIFAYVSAAPSGTPLPSPLSRQHVFHIA